MASAAVRQISMNCSGLSISFIDQLLFLKNKFLTVVLWDVRCLFYPIPKDLQLLGGWFVPEKVAFSMNNPSKLSNNLRRLHSGPESGSCFFKHEHGSVNCSLCVQVAGSCAVLVK